MSGGEASRTAALSQLIRNQTNNLKSNSINASLKSESSCQSTIIEGLKLSFCIDNINNIFFIAVAQKMLENEYVPQLLTSCKLAFSVRYNQDDETSDYGDYFEPIFEDLYNSIHSSNTSNKPDAAANKSDEGEKNDSLKKRKKKMARKWDDQSLSKEEASNLDYSKSRENDDSDKTDYTKGFENIDDFLSLHTENNSIKNRNHGKKGLLSGLFDKLIGQKNLTQEALNPVLVKMRDHLASKNVAASVSDSLTHTVSLQLLGRPINNLTSVNQMFQDALQDSLEKMLVAGGTSELMEQIENVREKEKRPFVIAFIGVNGVGKSTNLSKVAFWLLQKKYSVLMAACDTFRSGAVEQLRAHVTRLSTFITNNNANANTRIQLFEKGYGKDSASIASEAISYARSNNFDIVLIDTAGRMQDNEPLMRALAKLIHINHPDRVIFVGEALVGNEATDQLEGFNQAISEGASGRTVDGLLLTKFDTIDDKVGAVISMTFTSGAPVLFLGTGQTYTDLKRMNVQLIVQSLLSQ